MNAVQALLVLVLVLTGSRKLHASDIQSNVCPSAAVATSSTASPGSSASSSPNVNIQDIRVNNARSVSVEIIVADDNTGFAGAESAFHRARPSPSAQQKQKQQQQLQHDNYHSKGRNGAAHSKSITVNPQLSTQSSSSSARLVASQPSSSAEKEGTRGATSGGALHEEVHMHAVTEVCLRKHAALCERSTTVSTFAVLPACILSVSNILQKKRTSYFHIRLSFTHPFTFTLTRLITHLLTFSLIRSRIINARCVCCCYCGATLHTDALVVDQTRGQPGGREAGHADNAGSHEYRNPALYAHRGLTHSRVHARRHSYRSLRSQLGALLAAVCLAILNIILASQCTYDR